VDASIIDYKEGPCSFGQQFRGECPEGVQDLSGGDMPFSPDWKGSLTAQYTMELQTSFDLRLQGSVRFQDDILFSLSQDENSEFDGYQIVDASVALIDKDDKWNATVYLKNALDEFYISAIVALPAVFVPNAYVQQVPRYSERTAGLSSSVSSVWADPAILGPAHGILQQLLVLGVAIGFGLVPQC